MKVSITQVDIDSGKRADYANCPGVLAVKRQTGAYHVKIDSEFCYVQMKRGQKSEQYKISANFFKWMTRFDRGHKVKPRTFNFEFFDFDVKMARTPKVEA